MKLWSKNFIAVSVANFFASFGFYLLMPVLPIYLVKTIQLPESQMGIVLSTYTLALLIFRPFSGYLVDTFKRKPLYILSVLLFSLIFGSYLLAASLTAFMIVRFLHGTTWGLTTVSGNTLAIDIIPAERRGQGLGYYGLMMNLAMASAPYFGILAYEKIGYEGLIGLCVLSGIISILCASSIKVKVKPKVETPPLSLDRFILVRALPIGLNLMFTSISYGMIVSYGVLYGDSIGITNTGLLFLFFAIGIGLSRIIAGGWIDKGYIHRTAITAITTLAISLTIFSLFHSIWIFCISALFIGVGFGIQAPTFQTLFVNMGTHHQRGTANSTYLTCFDTGLGLGMLLGGTISQWANMSMAFLFGAIACVIAIPFYIFISKPLYERKKITQ